MSLLKGASPRQLVTPDIPIGAGMPTRNGYQAEGRLGCSGTVFAPPAAGHNALKGGLRMTVGPGLGTLGARNLPQAEEGVGRWRPQWLHCGPAPKGGDLLSEWRRFVVEHPTASIYFMPDIALLPGQNVHEPVVYAHWHDSGRLRALAILPTRSVKLSIAPRVSTSLAGRRLLENTLLVDGTGDLDNQFAASVCTLLDAPGMDCLILPDADVASPLRPALWKVTREKHLLYRELAAPEPHRWIRFPQRPEDYWAQFSKKTRYNFRYRAKHLEHTVRRIQSPQEIEEFVKLVDELIDRTWQHRRLGLKIDPAQKLELWREIARLGAFRSYLLMQGNRAIAFAMGVQWKRHFTYEDTGYDPEFAVKSPGQVLLYRVIEDLIAENTPEMLDFGYGENEYKRIYSNHETLSGPIMIVRNALLPCMAVRASQLRSAVGRAARVALSRAGAMSLLRHLHRGHTRLGKTGSSEAPASSAPPAESTT